MLVMFLCCDWINCTYHVIWFSGYRTKQCGQKPQRVHPLPAWSNTFHDIIGTGECSGTYVALVDASWNIHWQHTDRSFITYIPLRICAIVQHMLSTLKQFTFPGLTDSFDNHIRIISELFWLGGSVYMGNRMQRYRFLYPTFPTFSFSSSLLYFIFCITN